MDEKLTQTESSDITTHLDAVEKLVVLWDPSIYHLPLLRGHYFRTIDEVISLSISGHCLPEHLQTRAERVLEITMSRLEDKFCRLMMRNQFLTETEWAHVLQQSESNHRSYRTGTMLSDHYNCQTDIVSAISHTNSILSTPQTNSDYNTPSSYSPISFSSYSAEHPDEYRSAFDYHLGNIFDATEIFMGDISDLKAIANRMIRANYLPKLTRAFVNTCSEIVANDFSLMEFRKLTKEEAQTLSWDALSHEMKNWVRVTKVTFQVTLPRKRWLCDEIFGKETASGVFDEAVKSSVMNLIKFVRAASHRKGSAKIIFHLLSMYETLTDAQAGARRLFDEASEKSMYTEIESTIRELGNTILHILPVWLGDLAQNGLSHTTEFSKEGIDKFTKYAMSYISLLVVHHRHSLNLLLYDELGTSSDAVLQGARSEMTPLAHKVLTLISYLNSVLEHKSKNMESGFQEIFLINNLHYVLDSVKNSELKMQLKADWSQELEEQILKLLARYLKSSWGDLLDLLNDKSLRQRKGHMPLVSTYRTAYRRMIKRFNSVFETRCNLQSRWKVPDPQLRRDIRMAISRAIIPVYNSFLEKNHHFVSFGVDLEMYTTEALEDRIFGLFEGC